MRRVRGQVLPDRQAPGLGSTKHDGTSAQPSEVGLRGQHITSLHRGVGQVSHELGPVTSVLLGAGVFRRNEAL